MSSPSHQQITQVVELLNIDQAKAIILLKKNNNSLEQSVEAYFTDPTGSIVEDQYDRTWQPQDNVPYADDTGSTGALPAMSRPPSRVDNPQEIEDLTQTHAEANATAKTNFPNNQEDEDLRRAVALSLGQEDISTQENGVTGTGQQFGPATKDYYKPSDWAVVPVSTSREIIDHQPPSKRRRIEGQPAFLRGSKQTGYLGPLLTIYNSIPLAREALLLPSLPILRYGHDANWWSGTTDETHKSLSLSIDQQADANQINLLAELQCLMAFLGGTDRAYGSVDALSEMPALKSFASGTAFSRLLEAWQHAAMLQCPQEQLTQIFSSTAMMDVGQPDPISKEMICLEPIVSRIPGQLMVDLLDRTVWNDDINQLDDVWISQAGEIFTMRMYDPTEQAKGLELTIPTVWYPDRYTWALREDSRRMRHQVRLIRQKIDHYTSLQKKCQTIDSPSRKEGHSIKDVLQSVTDLCSRTSSGDRSGPQGQQFDKGGGVNALELELQAMMRRIGHKIAKLENKKIELQKEIRKLTIPLTEPSNDPQQPPFMKYTLQGVATKEGVTYVRQQNPDLLGLEDEEHNDWQWWRIAWLQSKRTHEKHSNIIGPVTQAEAMKTNGSASESETSYSIIKVQEHDVIEAAREEHHSVVLVYANENALRFTPSALSGALKQFVEEDNQSFAKELEDDLEPQPEWTPEANVTFEDVQLNDNPQRTSDREMTPMSISSPRRDEDGQPSPKRPKSSGNELGAEMPPPYEDLKKPEMQERKLAQNKIGLYAEQMLEKYGNGDGDQVEALHIEHPTDLPR